MSATSNREAAVRVFAGEYNDAEHEFREGDDEYAPRYVLLPSGAKANRVFIVGTLTDKEDVGNDGEYWRARVAGPTGTFVMYAGQYQPEAMNAIKSVDPPEYLAVVGKVRTYEDDDSGEIYTSVRPEDVAVVDAETRDKWVKETAERTMDRLEAEDEYVEMARDIHGEDTQDNVQSTVTQALEELDGEDDE